MRIIGRICTATLVVLAIGLVSWFAYARITDASLIVFRTGSMSPTMPQGALAVTQSMSAAEVQVDDVVTVQRAGAKLPVTHRVIEVRPEAELPVDAPAGARELILQGDANANPDAAPYIVTQVRKTVVSAPYLGRVLMIMQSPVGLMTLSLGVGALITWAFWPPRYHQQKVSA